MAEVKFDRPEDPFGVETESREPVTGVSFAILHSDLRSSDIRLGVKIVDRNCADITFSEAFLSRT